MNINDDLKSQVCIYVIVYLLCIYMKIVGKAPAG